MDTPSPALYPSVMHKQVVVLGAGFGGLELTTILSDEFGDALDLVLIDKGDEFGGDLVGRVDVDFLSGPKPTGTFQEPSEALVAEKALFGSSRLQRWFGIGTVLGHPASGSKTAIT